MVTTYAKKNTKLNYIIRHMNTIKQIRLEFMFTRGASLFVGTQEEAARAYDIAAIEYRGVNAVTNFDLSTYIRWLKQGTKPPVAAQEPTLNIESHIAPSYSISSSGESRLPTLQSKELMVDDTRAPCKKEVFQSKFPIGSCNKSSPTALGLLLRSSIFRELVEKNVNNTSDDENDGEEDIKSQPQMGSDEEYAGILYDGMGDNIPFVLSNAPHAIDQLQGVQFWL